ncbi:feruloyl esterase [Rhodoferax sp. OV413]|uniref:tannase/feruloyl esterase family alpha/beta hydrolase n=1 Tax=Rhodoferax sp. OV413 TaxID=1855285 RepID=UPI0008845BB5|nr:tannase/feruloyl esterase family alpha/beta hydrolase [Rhodoferax sp. OV413]SDP45722.1 feruloyl esterase [Rhodoferax sp. OV413]
MTAKFFLPILLSSFGLAACGGSDNDTLPQLAAAQPATIANCATLSGFSFARTTIASASVVAAGTLSNAGQPVGEHCLVVGRMNERISAVDGQNYAIGFQMRLPKDWSGRFLYQANGGTDGNVAVADGGSAIGSGGLLRNGLQMGFAIISSDAGHSSAQNPLFGLDPQARLDYGYTAVGTLTPMAKALVKEAYGKAPDRSYIAGTSNGGRHAMVAASRYADAFDGVLATSPGINLPRAAVGNLSNVKRWATVTTIRVVNGLPDYESALPKAEREVVASAILDKCDALDGLKDGLVQDIEACREAFAPLRDIPACAGARDGSCLSATQKTVIAAVFSPARNRVGDAIYSGFPFDAGIVQTDWAEWKFRNSLRTARNPVCVGYMFSSPPVSDLGMATDTSKTAAFALNFDIDTDGGKIFATSGIYTESAISFMTPPNATKLDTLRNRGAKMVVVHGASDAIFSVDDTQAWYQGLDTYHRGRASEFARFFRVPGMGHSRGGPATDQYDALSALVAWVEQGKAPERIVASARGAGNVGGVNSELPAGWSAQRSRPLCPYPQVARYQSGDSEVASSFACRP